jgi:hypothetical protein
MQHVIEAAAEAAFDRYVDTLALQAIPAGQFDLFEQQNRDEAREWHGIWIACERAAVSA